MTSPLGRGCAGAFQFTPGRGVAFAYDGRGNMSSDGVNAYGYDILNRLISRGSATLGYDPAGRLVQTVNGATTTRMLYDGAAMIGEYNGLGALQRRFVHGPGLDEPLVWYEGAGTSDRRWLLADERGSIVAVSDGAGAATNINTYDEYGVPGAGNVGRFQYTGQMWLSEVGVYHYKNRAYAPSLGRFLQTDPIGTAGGVNLYAYVGGDPMNLVDPSGWCASGISGRATAAQGSVCSGSASDPSYANLPGNIFHKFYTLMFDGEGGGGSFEAKQMRNPLTCSRTGNFGCGADEAEDREYSDAMCASDEASAAACAVGLIAPFVIGACVAGGCWVIGPRVDSTRLAHIFRNAPGHFAQATRANIRLLESVTRSQRNFLGRDRFGNGWYARLNSNGTQTWVQVRNGRIVNGGINQTPRTFNPRSGLSG